MKYHKRSYNRTDLVCPTCKKVFTVLQCEIRKKRKYCSYTCIRRSPATKKKMSITKLGSLNPMWKGNSAGLDAIHIWVAKRKKKPKKCVRCRKAPPRDLANISQKYYRKISDWRWLCRRCHMLSDGRMKNLNYNH
jgi:hypothetical protein